MGIGAAGSARRRVIEYGVSKMAGRSEPVVSRGRLDHQLTLDKSDVTLNRNRIRLRRKCEFLNEEGWGEKLQVPMVLP
jgi:hypothetical protein